jgi:hypothetical protein
VLRLCASRNFPFVLLQIAYDHGCKKILGSLDIKSNTCQMLGSLGKSLNQIIGKVREFSHATIGATC